VDEGTRRGGRFITLEGADGAGKSEQARRLAARLRASGSSVTLTREPGGTPLGERVRAVILDPDAERTPEADALLFNAARAQLVAEVIRPALARGDTVVCDRFADSTIAYQVTVRASIVSSCVTSSGLRPVGSNPTSPSSWMSRRRSALRAVPAVTPRNLRGSRLARAMTWRSTSASAAGSWRLLRRSRGAGGSSMVSVHPTRSRHGSSQR
jgi:hypothetical protein